MITRCLLQYVKVGLLYPEIGCSCLRQNSTWKWKYIGCFLHFCIFKWVILIYKYLTGLGNTCSELTASWQQIFRWLTCCWSITYNWVLLLPKFQPPHPKMLLGFGIQSWTTAQMSCFLYTMFKKWWQSPGKFLFIGRLKFWCKKYKFIDLLFSLLLSDNVPDNSYCIILEQK